MSVTYKEICEAAQEIDSVSDEKGIAEVCRLLGVAPDALTRAAEQRALRMGVLMAGTDPTTVDLDKVLLPREIQRLIPILGAMYMDGLATGIEIWTNYVRDRDENDD